MVILSQAGHRFYRKCVLMYPTHFHPLAARKHAGHTRRIRFGLAVVALAFSMVAFIAAYGLPLLNQVLSK